eukprot:m.55488 g.55488  ORF g.55488 m.55488 type:complete len:103 (+) comp34476_c0_seq4:1089-1397(+)
MKYKSTDDMSHLDKSLDIVANGPDTKKNEKVQSSSAWLPTSCRWNTTNFSTCCLCLSQSLLNINEDMRQILTSQKVQLKHYWPGNRDQLISKRPKYDCCVSF